MELSSPRYKALAVTFGFSFWFFIITTSMKSFSIEFFVVFVIGSLILTQIFALKLNKILDIFAKFNTKIFLGLLFISIFSIYGIVFRILRIDLLRTTKQKESYWLEMDILEDKRLFKQY